MRDTENRLKHILFFSRSFWPDTEATGQFITELCAELANKYKVTVIAGCSYYIKEDYFRAFSLYRKEKLGKVTIFRVMHTKFWKGNLVGRIMNWLTYGILALLVALRLKKVDLIIISTDPPFLGILAMVLKKIKSTAFIYNCRDLYFDVAMVLGKLKPGLIAKVYDYLDKKAFNAAATVVPLGLSMQRRLIAKGVDRRRIRVISDWVDTGVIKPVAKENNPLLRELGLENKFIIMYSGNIGLTQNLDSILRAVADIKKPSSFFLVFAGEGAAKKGLRELAQELGVQEVLFLPYQPMEMLSYSLGMADLHIVSFQKGLSGAIVPSKVYGIMAAARPYLAIGDKESEPAILANEFGCGLLVEPDDIVGITKAFDWALAHTEELRQMGKRGRELAEARFDKNSVLKDWFSLLEDFN